MTQSAKQHGVKNVTLKPRSKRFILVQSLYAKKGFILGSRGGPYTDQLLLKKISLYWFGIPLHASLWFCWWHCIVKL